MAGGRGTASTTDTNGGTCLGLKRPGRPRGRRVGLRPRFSAVIRASGAFLSGLPLGATGTECRTVIVAGSTGPAGEATPDGRAIGTVTAYCKGMTYCPAWVNNQ
jgi:hypothetical protein